MLLGALVGSQRVANQHTATASDAFNHLTAGELLKALRAALH
jgi:hypothetical protein